MGREREREEGSPAAKRRKKEQKKGWKRRKKKVFATYIYFVGNFLRFAHLWAGSHTVDTNEHGSGRGITLDSPTDTKISRSKCKRKNAALADWKKCTGGCSVRTSRKQKSSLVYSVSSSSAQLFYTLQQIQNFAFCLVCVHGRATGWNERKARTSKYSKGCRRWVSWESVLESARGGL